jgi:hypothetical protein
MLYKALREGRGRVALPVEGAIEAAMPGIQAMLYQENHDPIGQVAEISVLRIYHLRDFVVQLPILPHNSRPPQGWGGDEGGRQAQDITHVCPSQGLLRSQLVRQAGPHVGVDGLVDLHS